VQQIKQIPYLSAKLVKEKVLYQKFKDKEFYNDIHALFRDIKSNPQVDDSVKKQRGSGEIDTSLR
jgi:hypothetical protein